ncbi:MAG: class II fructose-bisphosphatase [Blastochloris sp.]|nr:class II fructose-bisphosphatase [Blastochloris sp.]
MSQDTERTIEFEFVRATENAALNSLHWLGRGEKEKADFAACDAIYGVFDKVPICGEVVLGEGIKDNAPGIFLGEHLGTWQSGSPAFDIALDPIDGTTNIAKGMPNSISVICGAQTSSSGTHVMKNIPSFYAEKLAYGPRVVHAMKRLGIRQIQLDCPVDEILSVVARALGKRVSELMVALLDRPRHNKLIEEIRQAGAALRLLTDGDITAAVAPSLPDSGIDLYIGIGGSPEGILTAAALKCLGGEIQLRMWPRDQAEMQEIDALVGREERCRIYTTNDLVSGDSSIFCATGISDSYLLPGVKVIGNTAITNTILMRARSRTVRYIKAVHNLDHKTIHLRSDRKDHRI